jgi:hypothetical protein
MKTRSLVMAVALMFIASVSLVAQNPSPSFEILNQPGSSVYKLVYKAPGKGSVNLKISDKAGVLYSESLSFTDQFIFPLDFKGMSKGEYTVVVSDKKHSLSESLAYDVKIPLAYVHVAKQPNEKYLLSIRSEAPTDFTVRIFDRWNREVLEKSESVSDEFALVYNLSRLSGPFNFEVTNSAGDVAIIQH